MAAFCPRYMRGIIPLAPRRERRAEYSCLIAGQENERGAPLLSLRDNLSQGGSTKCESIQRSLGTTTKSQPPFQIDQIRWRSFMLNKFCCPRLSTTPRLRNPATSLHSRPNGAIIRVGVALMYLENYIVPRIDALFRLHQG